MLVSKPLDLVLLTAQLNAAGFPTFDGLCLNNDIDLFAIHASARVEIPAAAQPVIDAHIADSVKGPILTIAQSAVGVQLLALTANQQRALLACLLYKAGALDASLTVLPLIQWVL